MTHGLQLRGGLDPGGSAEGGPQSCSSQRESRGPPGSPSLEIKTPPDFTYSGGQRILAE